MKKIYNSVELSVVRLRAHDIIVTSPEGFSLSGISAGSSSEDYTTTGSDIEDYVW